MLLFSKVLLQRTGKVMGEKVVRYFEERVRAKVCAYVCVPELVCDWIIRCPFLGHPC